MDERVYFLGELKFMTLTRKLFEFQFLCYYRINLLNKTRNLVI